MIERMRRFPVFNPAKLHREEDSALTKAKAMLKFRETYQKRLEQRERAGQYNKLHHNLCNFDTLIHIIK